MEQKPNEIAKTVREQRLIPTVSAILNDGVILEMVYRPALSETAFVLWQNGQWSLETSFHLNDHERLIPYSPKNNLITNEVVRLPSQPEEYNTEEQLLSKIQNFIHRYVDLSPLFEKIASYYVLFSWIYDGFNELPYLRVRGDTGSGKTRFLLTVGSLCYKPIFASGASTVSPLFRILDAFRGTLIIDEGDFRFSDERAEIVKILNNGNAKGFPVLRTETVGRREFNPVAYLQVSIIDKTPGSTTYSDVTLHLMTHFREIHWLQRLVRYADHISCNGEPRLHSLPEGDLIGIGAAVTRRPLPHHRAYGSVHGGSIHYASPHRSRTEVRGI